MVEMLRDISRPGAEAERVAEIGENDFRYGLLESSGHYYHWTRFSEITETPDGLFLVLAEDRKIIIPRSAFQSEGEAVLSGSTRPLGSREAQAAVSGTGN